ncbi:MAG: hypothetical protein ACXVCP_10800 [Bdellovibrio sp.]
MNLKQVLLITVLFIGCSKNDSNVSGTPPNKPPIIVPPSDGSAELTSLTAVFEASQAIGTKKNKQTTVYFMDAKKDSTSRARELVKDKTNLVQNKILNGNCKLDVKHPADDISSSDGAASLFPRMKVRIDGPNCPLEVTLDMTVVSDTHDPHEVCEETSVVKICKFVAQTKMKYKILDDKFGNDLNVKNGELNMSFKVEQTFTKDASLTQENADMVMIGNTDFDFKALDLTGKSFIVTGSQDFDVKMSLPDPGNPDHPGKTVASMKETMQFINECAKKSIRYTANVIVDKEKPVEEYTINDVAVTAENYASEREKFSNSMLSFGKREGKLQYELPSPVPKFGSLSLAK